MSPLEISIQPEDCLCSVHHAPGPDDEHSDPRCPYFRKPPMRVLITGSRSWRDVETIRQELRKLPPGSTIVHGSATGADAIAHSIAIDLGLIVEPHWPNYARDPVYEAPKIRNKKMVNLGADLCLAFPSSKSGGGTMHCASLASMAGIKTRVIRKRK